MVTPTSASSLLRTEQLCKQYPDGSVNALVDANLEVPAGQFVAIMGPSGSGKSTLLNLLGALDVPTSGTVYLDGRPLWSWPSLDRVRSEMIGFVFQSFHLLPTLTAAENVQVPMFAGPKSASERARTAGELLELVGLSHRAKHHPSQLSVGERQRVSIARALANQPRILLADEPTGNLDSRTGAEILALFAQLHRQLETTLIVVTHTAEVAAKAQRVLHLHDGRIQRDELGAGDVSC